MKALMFDDSDHRCLPAAFLGCEDAANNCVHVGKSSKMCAAQSSWAISDTFHKKKTSVKSLYPFTNTWTNTLTSCSKAIRSELGRNQNHWVTVQTATCLYTHIHAHTHKHWDRQCVCVIHINVSSQQVENTEISLMRCDIPRTLCLGARPQGRVRLVLAPCLGTVKTEYSHCVFAPGSQQQGHVNAEVWKHFRPVFLFLFFIFLLYPVLHFCLFISFEVFMLSILTICFYVKHIRLLLGMKYPRLYLLQK